MNLPLIPGSLPTGWCPTQGTTFWQEIYNKFFALGVAQLALGTGYTIKVSNDEPTAEERDNTLWYKTVGGVPERIYYYYGGHWVCPHPVQDTTFLWMVKSGTEASIWSLDGGDGTDPSVVGNVSDYTGSFWKVAHEFDFRFPIGPGTNPIAYDGGAASVISVEGTGGVERHILTPTEGGDVGHSHTFGRQEATSGDDVNDVVLLKGTSTETGLGVYVNGEGSNTLDKDISTLTGAYLVTSESTSTAPVSHTNMPPYVGVWFVQRTARKFYTS